MNTVKAALVTAALVLPVLPQTGLASSGGPPLPQEDWSFKGIFGQFDQAALKRGAKVTIEVCLGCHSIKYIKFDHLRQFGFTEAEVSEMAGGAGLTKQDKLVSGLAPADAKESFGLVPPDLSLMTKARKGYEDYTFAILTGYLTEEDTALVDAAKEDGTLSPEEITKLASALHMDPHHPEKIDEAVKRIANGDHFNKYFPGNFLAMPAPLSAGAVTYADGTEATVKQLAKDVTTFLAWAAEPTQTERKSTGHKVILYLIVLTAMLYAVKRRIWARVHH
ncbi:MAG: hypothetical protein HQL82_03940 [Magnetococcales bacterium]|nr:hypothetical protein [Magnetococcales bacterium]